MKKSYISLICTIMLLLSACTAQEPPVPVQPASAQKPHPVFLLIPKEKRNPYMIKMYEGFAAACAEIGAEPRFGGPEDTTAQEQIAIIDRAIDQGGVSVIAVAANDADMLSDALRRASEAGIKIISLDSAVNKDSRMAHIQQANPEIVGRALIQATSRMIGGRGQVGLVSTTPTAANQQLWIEWMHRELNENPDKYTEFELLPVVYGDDLPDRSRLAAEALLDKHPDLSAMIVPSVVGMLAVGEVLRERDSDVIFTGLGLPSEIATFIEDGSCPWMYLWNPYDIGYLAAWTGSALLNGEIEGREGDNFMAGRLGQRVVSASVDGGTEVLLGDPVKFDIENIEEWKLIY